MRARSKMQTLARRISLHALLPAVHPDGQPGVDAVQWQHRLIGRKCRPGQTLPGGAMRLAQAGDPPGPARGSALGLLLLEQAPQQARQLLGRALGQGARATLGLELCARHDRKPLAIEHQGPVEGALKGALQHLALGILADLHEVAQLRTGIRTANKAAGPPPHELIHAAAGRAMAVAALVVASHNLEHALAELGRGDPELVAEAPQRRKVKASETVEEVDQCLVRQVPVALEVAQGPGHLAGPDDRHANALAVEPECVLEVWPAASAAAVEPVHEGLNTVAERVRVLEQQRPVLLEGVGVGQEHGLGPDDLLVDD
eukprot:CAMPEP_0168496912 /NCGR_PEP_ID=MMETSP0228-20121227/72502_1 /TAXON_ID=133427 /ORGANISM="Protoceratium reticulatum, Strain CCCM 535 (=CCMP 1889)" /LENGTH=315 /DNA_ID=CAMNT_0008513787 /DNA_START=15 /DNA_END=959 /DNA_ORIENTATION=+